MLLDEVAETFAAVAASSARLAKVERLAARLRRLEPEEVHPAVAFLAGELGSARSGSAGPICGTPPTRRPPRR